MKHVEFYSKFQNWETSACSWFYYKNLSRYIHTENSDYKCHPRLKIIHQNSTQKKKQIQTPQKKYMQCVPIHLPCYCHQVFNLWTHSYCTPSTQQKVDFTQDTKYMGETIHHRSWWLTETGEESKVSVHWINEHTSITLHCCYTH